MPKQEAIALFTDRTEPQQAFAQTYLAMAATQGTQPSRVLTYYGMGGIGKSTLLTKLEDNLTADPKLAACSKGKPLVVNFNFERHQEDIKVLMSLRNMLGSKYKWKFPRFELGLYLYSQNIGEDADAPEDTGYLEKAGLKPAVEIAGEIPIFGSIIKAISILDQGQAAVRTLMKQHSAMVKEFEELTTQEQKEALPTLFATDLNACVQKAKSPLVIMLDTFECVTETSGTQDSLFGRDYWLYGENGLIPTAKNVLFVIAGRHKLKWEPEGFAMEQHLLGSLSPEDACSFLTAAGLPEALMDHLCKLTDGVPVYLDVCVRQYRQLMKKKITPEKEHFGGSSEVLIRRYVRYMDKTEKELVRMLVFLPEWDQDLVRQAATQVLGGFSLADYNRILKLSITSESDKGRYFIHRTVADILQKDPENTLRQDTANFLIGYCKKLLDAETPYSDSYADAASWLLTGGMLLHEDRDSLATFYQENMEKTMDLLHSCRRQDQLRQILDRYWAKAQEKKDDRLYAAALQEKVWRSYQLSGVDPTAMAGAWESLLLHTKLLGEQDFESIRTLSLIAIFLEVSKHPRDAIPVFEHEIRLLEQFYPDKTSMILNTRRNLALCYHDAGELEQSHRLYVQLLEEYTALLGPTHHGTLRALRDVAISHRERKEYEQSRALAENALALCRQTYTENHPDTLRALSTLIFTCAAMGDHEEEFRLREELIALRAKHLGENHADTLGAMLSLGNSFTKQNQHLRALPLREKAVEYMYDAYGEHHKTYQKNLMALCYTYSETGQTEKARALMEGLLTLRQQDDGPESPDTLQAMDALATICSKQNDYAAVVELLLPLAEIRLRMDETSLTAIGTVEKLAYAYYKLGDQEKEIASWLRAYDLRNVAYGPTPPESQKLFKQLVSRCIATERYCQAISLQQKQLWELRDRLGETHHDTYIALLTLVAIQHKAEPERDLMSLYMEHIAHWQQLWGENNPKTINAIGLLGGHVCMRTQETALALELLTMSRDLRKQHPGRPDYSVMYLMGECHRRLGMQEEALSLLKGALAGKQQLGDPTDLVLRSLGMLLKAMGQEDQGEKLLQTAKEEADRCKGAAKKDAKGFSEADAFDFFGAFTPPEKVCYEGLSWQQLLDKLRAPYENAMQDLQPEKPTTLSDLIKELEKAEKKLEES